MRCHSSQAAFLIVLAMCSLLAHDAAQCAEVIRLTESNWDATVPEGKEVDAIYGDWVLRNGEVIAVIGDAIEGRNANMTVRNVGGSLIDFTRRDAPNDQLSAYYPVGTGYKLSGPAADGKQAAAQGAGAMLAFQGQAIDGRSNAEVQYELADGAPWLKITTRITNTSAEPLDLQHVDAIRADGEFEFETDDDLGVFWAYDPFWRQAYAIALADPALHFALGKGDRGSADLKLAAADPKQLSLAAGQSRDFVRYVFPGADTCTIRALAHDLRKKPLVQIQLDIRDPAGPVEDAILTLRAKERVFAQAVTGREGHLALRLAAGEYQAVVAAPGRGQQTLTWHVAEPRAEKVELPAPGVLDGKITERDGRPIACKVQFIGRDGTPSPKLGPDSAIYGVRNVRYTENGEFRLLLEPGKYDVIISHGPEYDAFFTTIEINRASATPLRAALERTVDTRGWLSTDFHGHSSPSGDNTASQRGRVLNLLAEHIEFAPCTEHNRITTYDEHVEFLHARDRMLTCPGMELTGRPLPINHQNAFPLIPHPRTQDGGAPQPDVNPVMQIERLAMWDHGSDKLVQINHPNIPQMVGDRDTDGSPDGGFEKMFSFMDVIEVHPLDNIFKQPEALPDQRDQGNAIFHWMQLLNLGYRLPGVVNTDAHWNFHGSGGLRNYVKCAVEDPTKASVAELVHTCEHGNIVMTNGPFLEVSAVADRTEEKANVGDDLKSPGGKLTLHVRVEHPNWFEVNRVQVFVNGRPDAALNFTQRTHPQMFQNRTVVFDQKIAVALDRDAHLIVAAAGEDKQLGAVAGPDHAKEMPCAVGNPIFVDVDGNDFEPNGDQLGLPLVREPGAKPSKGHRHPH